MLPSRWLARTARGANVMLILTDSEPMRFAARCDTCGAREGPLDADTREEAAKALARLSWRIDERFTKATICPKCAGPPSVFPAAKVIADPPRCSECDAHIDRCTVCQESVADGDVMSCRRAHGHAHARCATQKMPRLSLPED